MTNERFINHLTPGVSTKRSHVLQESCSFQLQGCVSMHDLLVGTPGVKGFSLFLLINFLNVYSLASSCSGSLVTSSKNVYRYLLLVNWSGHGYDYNQTKKKKKIANNSKNGEKLFKIMQFCLFFIIFFIYVNACHNSQLYCLFTLMHATIANDITWWAMFFFQNQKSTLAPAIMNLKA